MMTLEEARQVFVEKKNRMVQLGATDQVVEAMLAMLEEINRLNHAVSLMKGLLQDAGRPDQG